MYELLVRSHSGLRWVVLVLLLLAIAKAFAGWMNGRPYTEGDKKIMLFSLITVHLQLVIGLILYFLSPTVEVALSDMSAAMKSSALRFWAVEHISMMVLSIVLITIGYSRSKRASNDLSKFRRIAIFYTIGLLLILASIPWPFRADGIARAWF